MKIILKVALTELRTLFYSPIAWFLMIVFMIQSGISFFGQMDMVVRQIEISGGKHEYYGSITESVFLGTMGMFNNVMGSLYLYIPLLTMSLISREISSGTIRLLYSSPVRMYEIVFGKYIAMMVYSLLLVLIVGLFIVSGIMNIQHAETGMLLSALFGFYLLLCAYSAIGLFMSCLTSYQVVAAISTFVMIGVLSYISTVWQDVDFVRTLTYYLSINGRAQKLLAGLITTRDVLYFFVIVYIFLGLSIFKLRAGMESRPKTVKTMRYVAVVASALVIGYISSLPGLIGYWDTTFNSARTLTPRVQQIIKNLGDTPLNVTAYANLIDRYYYLGAPTAYNSTKAKWEPYLRFNQNILLDKVTYYDTVLSPEFAKRNAGKSTKEVAEQYAHIMKVELKDLLAPAQIRKQIDLSGEGNRYVMKLQWKDRTTFLRVFDDIYVWPFETEVAAALLRLQQTSLPTIAFVNSELERETGKSGDRDYEALTNRPSFRHSLVNQGFDVVSLSLESDSIPPAISAMVIADPRLALSSVAMKKLKQYTESGGNLLIAGEPGKQAVLNPFLKELGVQLNEDPLIQESANDAPDFISAFIDKKAGAFYKPLEYVIEDSLKLTMPGAVGISYAKQGPFAIQPLATTDGQTSWSRHKPLDLSIMTRASVLKPVTPGRDSTGTIVFNEADGDIRGPVTTVVALSRKVNGKEQHIVVAGDADFLSNKELSRQPRTANFVFSTSLFRWITQRGFPIDTSRPEPRDKKVDTTLDQLKWQRIIYLWVLPAVLAVFASVLLIRRKRK